MNDLSIQTLPNGVRFCAASLKERKSVALGIWVHIGGRYEEARQSGLSHFLEHLAFKGTAERTASQIKESIEGLGGSMNAFTSEEATCFLARVPSRYFESVFEVISDIVLNASLHQPDIERERKVILEEIKMVQDQPAQHTDELLAEALWPNHALGRPLTGSEQNVKSFKRNDIVDFKMSHYVTAQILVTAAGDVDQRKLEEVCRQRFQRHGPTGAAPVDILFGGHVTEPELRLLQKKTEQTHLALGVYGFSKDDPDEYVLDLMNIILGANMSSRLFTQVREERGLAYDIGSFVRKYHETGAFIVEAGVDHSKFDEAIKVILAELGLLRSTRVPELEIRRAKDFFVGQMELGLENGMNQMLWLGDSLIAYGRIKTPEEVAQKIESVQSADIQRVANVLFRSSALRLAAIGPRVNKTSIESLIKF